MNDDASYFLRLPILSFILDEDGVNALLRARSLPLEVKLEKDRLILLYQNRDFRFHTTIQVFIIEVEVHFPSIILTIDSLTLYNSLRVPSSLLALLEKKYPFLTYRKPYLTLDLSSFLPPGTDLAAADVDLMHDAIAVTLERLTLPASLFSA